jgi:hypothetical protein
MARRTENAVFSVPNAAELSENCLKIEVENVYNDISRWEQRRWNGGSGGART